MVILITDNIWTEKSVIFSIPFIAVSLVHFSLAISNDNFDLDVRIYDIIKVEQWYGKGINYYNLLTYKAYLYHSRFLIKLIIRNNEKWF